MKINKNIEKITKKLLEEIGEDPSREGLLKTPLRVSKSWGFLTEGYSSNIDKIINNAIFKEEYDVDVDENGPFMVSVERYRRNLVTVQEKKKYLIM